MARFVTAGICAVFLLCFSTGAAEDLAVLGETVDGAPPGEMMAQYLNDMAEPMFAERQERYEALETQADVEAYQERLHALFIEQLGGFPERTPLNARIVGRGEGEGFRYEKILYESRPGFLVSAILYLPLDPPPYPGVLVPCGHSANGKAYESYQRASILLAQNGMAALCYDPISQGERNYFFDASGAPAFGSTISHTLIGVGAILTGTNVAAYHIWDGMRGLDYLESRPEIDAQRLGCTGNSGGGTLTSYIMALDPRVQAAAPSCYITSLPRLLHTIAPQDAEQDIHGQIAFGMDHADYLHLRAPRPTLICAATEDFFDISGTWDSFREAKRLYMRFGRPQQVGIAEVDASHGFSQPLREAAVHWMQRWLLDRDAPVKEGDFPILSDKEAQCSPQGQVLLMEGSRSAFDLNVERAEQLRAQREAFWRDNSVDAAREKVRELISARPYEELGAPEVEEVGEIEREGCSIQKLILRSEEGIALPALLFHPADAPRELVLYAHGEGKAAEAGAGGAIEQLVQQGAAVLAVDLRGLGETQASYHGGEWAYVGKDFPDYFRAYMMTRTYVGFRVDDLYSSVRYLREEYVQELPLRLHAVGAATVPALHAAALAPEAFDRVELREGIPSWKAVVETPLAREQLQNAVHNALRWYDLPDLAKLLADKLEQEDMCVPTFDEPVLGQTK